MLTVWIIAILCTGCSQIEMSKGEKITAYESEANLESSIDGANNSESAVAFSTDAIPSYSGTPYAVINNNVPFFNEKDYTTKSFESYSEPDELGRCGIAFANVGKDLMPTEERGNIGQVKPTGWHTVKYDNVDGKYLYNRCHLIGFQLTAENANEKNLITGTRYMNVDGMLPFENMVADYVKETNNHVLYRVTPIYQGDNMVASGVLMEAESVEDEGAGILYNIFVYNVQPGIEIDYTTGDSWISKNTVADSEIKEDIQNNRLENETTYILNTNSHKFHKPNCDSVSKISEKNKGNFTGTRDEIILLGYQPCRICNP